MKSQQINKVDLSLDDIIKLDGLDQQQEQNPGGNNRPQGNLRNKGQGQRGFRTTGQQGGGGQGVSGVSPLNRGKLQHSGSASNTSTNQRANGRAWGMKRGSGQWGGSGPSGGMNNMAQQGNNQQFNFSRTQRTNQGNNLQYHRAGNRGNNLQVSTQRRGNLTNQGSTRGGIRQGQGGLRGGQNQNHQGGNMGQGHSEGGSTGQGSLRITVAQAGPQGVRNQGQSQHGLNRMTFEEKRQRAMQALREARKTIAQLDQQAARENVVNTRRGITPQPSTQSPGLDYQNTADRMYASTLSLASDSSHSSSSSDDELQGRQITSFHMSSSVGSTQGQKQWQPKSASGSHSDSTLTISIDNPVPFISHSNFPPRVDHNPPPSHFHPSTPQPSTRHQNTQHWRPQSDSRQHWRQQDSRQRDRRQHFHHQPGSNDRMREGLDINRGATPGFSRQLAQLKPTVPMKYKFQKRTFATASTPVSLNDRFSAPAAEDPAGRKVFM